MIIVNGYLTSPPEGIDLTVVPLKAGPEIVPELIVIHYGVTDSLDALVSAQVHQEFGAHLSIDGYWQDDRSIVKVVQHIPFRRRASHAGASSWQGRESVNGFSIGIEISNPGPLKMGDDGKLRTVYGKVWDAADSVKRKHKNPDCPYEYWASYSDQELDLCAHITTLLSQSYPTIRDVVGHDDVSPGRKIDPGPAFPIDWLRKEVFR